jgi:hypothetical protein
MAIPLAKYGQTYLDWYRNNSIDRRLKMEFINSILPPGLSRAFTASISGVALPKVPVNSVTAYHRVLDELGILHSHLNLTPQTIVYTTRVENYFHAFV